MNIDTERAIDELRRQMGIVIHPDGGRQIANYPIEFLKENMLTSLRSPSLALIITAARAKILGLGEHDVKIEAHSLSLPQIMAICDPLCPGVSLPGLHHRQATDIDSMALKLAKHAGLLPALLLADASAATQPWYVLDSEALKEYLSASHSDVIETASASLPIEGAEKATLRSFRDVHGTSVHLVLIIGNIDSAKPPQAPPLVRIHSSCVTGDILGSLRCDCGDQLKLALAEIIKEGSGLLIYLHQEGRGIGITNKLRSYTLQEQGIDTFTANLMLGFDEDERDFSSAAAILKSLGIPAIRMLTNNPQKLSAMEKAGITVSQRVPLVSLTRPHSHAYIEAKTKKAGHLF